MTTFVYNRCLSAGRTLMRRSSLNLLRSKQCQLLMKSHLAAMTNERLSQNLKPDPYAAVEDDLKDTFRHINTELESSVPNLNILLRYYFDGQSKTRPAIVILMAKALNNHVHGYESILLPKQRLVAMIAEMFHTGASFHDITSATDGSKLTHENLTEMRQKAILLGDYVISMASLSLSRLGNSEVYADLWQGLSDVVQGEFIHDNRNSTVEESEDKASRYLSTTFKRTGSLIAHSCKAVAVLAGADPSIQDIAYQYGRNAGLTFQLVDDAAKLALNNECNLKDLPPDFDSQPSIFKTDQTVNIEMQRLLARHHCSAAIQSLQQLQDCPEKRSLIAITEGFLKKR